MFTYYLLLALRNLGRSRIITALMIIAVGVGVASCMTSYAVFESVSGDAIPWKSSRLFVPQIDILGPKSRTNGDEPASAMDYLDATALMTAHRAKLQSAMYEIAPSVFSYTKGTHPTNVEGHAVYSEFFPMLDVPFEFGSGWSKSEDDTHTAVAVISSKLNQRLFGGVNSVGSVINVDGTDYRITGVLNNWDPEPRFYDVVNNGGGFDRNSHDIFIQFSSAIDARIRNQGSINCVKAPASLELVEVMRSSCVWIAFMVELDSKEAASEYRKYLVNYSEEQRQSGRFGWMPHVQLRDLPKWLSFEHIVPADTKLSLVIAISLLIICLMNTISLLLAKFMRRSTEISVRRALGATRADIYFQFLVEAAVIGISGGGLGIILTWVGVGCTGAVLPVEIAGLAHINSWLLIETILVSIFTTILAGLYPTVRASRVQPALQLKMG